MWFERFVIIATTLARDYLPSSWSYYSPTWVEIGIFVGTLGIFFTLFLIFTRVAPVVAVAEVKSILKSAGDQYTGPNAHKHDHGHGKSTSPKHDHDTRGSKIQEAAGVVSSSMTSSATEGGQNAEKEIDIPDYGGLDDDLKKIEGIGPKIERVLKDAGIKSFAALSEMKTESLQYILDKGDGNFGGNDPQSWAEQGRLAAAGKWSELQKLQDRLQGGKY
jgi:predicted flap endonuclease-1-like 5' DNA nuclease